MIDPERSQVISKLPLSHNKKSMQSFMVKINFIWRFILSFAETVQIGSKAEGRVHKHQRGYSQFLFSNEFRFLNRIIPINVRN